MSSSMLYRFKSLWKISTIGGSSVSLIWSPVIVSGIISWYKADAESAYANSDSISLLTDWSGNGNHATRSGATRPTYQTNIINGLPIIRFSATQYLDVPI